VLLNKLTLRYVRDPEWAASLELVGRQQAEIVLGDGGLRGNYLCSVEGKTRPVCLFLPGVISRDYLAEVYPALKAVARRRAWSTKRSKVIGNHTHRRNRDGTYSSFARATHFEILKEAKEGVFGYSKTRECSFNTKFPEEYRKLVGLSEFVTDKLAEYWPEGHTRQLKLASPRAPYLIGRSLHSQAVCNLDFLMGVHTDDGNVKGQMSAEIVAGGYKGGGLILPRLSLCIALKPGDLLFFDGAEHHAPERFVGERLSCIWYLRPLARVR